MKILTACMIIKNEEKFLGRTLPNLVAGCDEVIVVDTGSSDGSVALAEKLGAHVFHFAWNDDFSAARNESIKHAASKWILWIDADEYIDVEVLKTLRNVLSTLEDVRSISVKITQSKMFQKTEGQYNFRNRIFINQAGIRFERPINEQLIIPVNIPGKDMFLSDVVIYHWGLNLDKDDMDKKNQIRIGFYRRFLEKNNADVVTRYLLAAKLMEMGLLDEALEEFDRLLEYSTNRIEYKIEGLRKKAEIYIKQKKYEDAAIEASRAYELDRSNGQSVCTAAQCLYMVGDFNKVIETLSDEAISKLNPNTATQVFFDQRNYNYHPYRFRGMSYLHLGNMQKGIEDFNRILAAYPDDGFVGGFFEKMGLKKGGK